MAEPLIPPDLIGAGVASQPQPDQPIRQTTLPNQAVQDLSLLQAMRPQTMAPNPGLAAGSGVLGALAGARGGNQYLAQHAQMADQGQRQQLQQVQLADRMLQRRREQEERQDEALMAIITGLKDSENPGARAVYGNEMARRAKRYGLNVSPAYFTQAAKIGKEELDLINGDIVAGLTPEQITARHPRLANMPPNWLRDQYQVMRNPAMRAKLGYKTDDELKADRTKRERETAEAEIAMWRAQHKDVDDKSLPYVAQFAQSRYGMPLIALDPKNPVHQKIKTEALNWAREQIKANDVAFLQLEESKRAHRVGESQKERELRLKEAEGPGGGKPLSAEATGQVIGMVRLGGAIETIDGIQKNPKARKIVDNYIGPYASRFTEVQTYAPGGFLGKVPQEVVDLRQSVASLKNYTIKLLTGAQMSEKEATRIANELFDMNLPPDQFWRRYENSKNVVGNMKKVVEAALIRGDRRALEAMLRSEGLAPAAPGPLSPTTPPIPTGTRRIRVRDNKTGKLHEAELGPGDMIPPGYTEIK